MVNCKNSRKDASTSCTELLQEHNQKIDERVLHELLNEVDLNKNGEIEIAEFFQVSWLLNFSSPPGFTWFTPDVP